MNKNIAQTLAERQPVALYREDKDLFYRKKLKKAGNGGETRELFPAPPLPDEETITRLNELARKPPFGHYHKWKNNNLL